MKKECINIMVEGVSLSLSVLRQKGSKPPVVFLHGFGSTKQEYADFANQSHFQGRSIIAYDAPGFGQTECADMTRLSIPFLQQTAKAVIDHYAAQPFHLIGHSMGGLTALMVADANPENVLSFTNIEGNLVPEDCFLSRQIVDHREKDETAFLDHLAKFMSGSSDPSGTFYAENLFGNTDSKVVAPIFRSMVALSDNTPLMDNFLELPMPKMFVYGEKNSSFPYLKQLSLGGVRLSKILGAGHFPMYANPSALWQAIGDFIESVEKERAHD